MDPILSILQRNALASHEDIAAQLDLAPAEVSARVRAHEENGVILGYEAVLDPEKADNDSVTAFIEVRITPERGGGFDSLALRIARFSQVKSCYLLSGSYDLLVIVHAHDLREVARFVTEKLSTLQGVLSTATHFQLRCYKNNSFLTAGDAENDRLSVAP